MIPKETWQRTAIFDQQAQDFDSGRIHRHSGPLNIHFGYVACISLFRACFNLERRLSVSRVGWIYIRKSFKLQGPRRVEWHHVEDFPGLLVLHHSLRDKVYGRRTPNILACSSCQSELSLTRRCSGSQPVLDLSKRCPSIEHSQSHWLRA